jgi:plasmid stability protein
MRTVTFKSATDATLAACRVRARHGASVEIEVRENVLVLRGRVYGPISDAAVYAEGVRDGMEEERAA